MLDIVEQSVQITRKDEGLKVIHFGELRLVTKTEIKKSDYLNLGKDGEKDICRYLKAKINLAVLGDNLRKLNEVKNILKTIKPTHFADKYKSTYNTIVDIRAKLSNLIEEIE